jgi:hypothetical protein
VCVRAHEDSVVCVRAHEDSAVCVRAHEDSVVCVCEHFTLTIVLALAELVSLVSCYPERW